MAAKADIASLAEVFEKLCGAETDLKQIEHLKTVAYGYLCYLVNANAYMGRLGCGADVESVKTLQKFLKCALPKPSGCAPGNYIVSEWWNPDIREKIRKSVEQTAERGVTTAALDNEATKLLSFRIGAFKTIEYVLNRETGTAVCLLPPDVVLERSTALICFNRQYTQWAKHMMDIGIADPLFVRPIDYAYPGRVAIETALDILRNAVRF